MYFSQNSTNGQEMPEMMKVKGETQSLFPAATDWAEHSPHLLGRRRIHRRLSRLLSFAAAADDDDDRVIVRQN